MSGLGNINVPQVQVGQSNAGQILAQSGMDYGQAARGFLGGVSAGQDQQRLEMQKGQLAQQAEMDQIKQQAMQMQLEEQKQQFMGDMAYGISKMPADKQEAGYKQVVGSLMQQGIIKDPPPMWSDGGKDLVEQLKTRSPRFAEEQQAQIGALKQQGDMDLQRARIGLVEAQTRGQDVKNSMGPQRKALSAEGAKIAGLAQSGLSGLDNLQKLLATSTTADLASGQYAPTSLQGQKAQDYDRLRTQVSETLGRLNSGGAINKDEEVRFLKMMPKWSDTDQTKQSKLDSLRTQIQTVQSSMGLGDNTQSSSDDGYSAAASQYPGLTQEQYRALTRGK